MLKKILVFLLLLFSLNLLSHNALAASLSTEEQEVSSPQKRFSTSYDVLYDIDSTGLATVTEKINLKNLTSEYYANQFKLTIGATDLFDIVAQDANGPLVLNHEQKGNITTIEVKFNQQVAGIGKILPWTISFKSKDFAQNIGKVWEIRVPKISSTINLESYNLTLALPLEFGEASLISPNPKTKTSYQGKTYLTYDLDQLKSTGISATFGKNQLFDFNLGYHLDNPNLMPILTNIALPPDTAYQDVIFQRINPPPINVTLDDDGNYLAWYRLRPKQKIDVLVYGSAKLYSDSKVDNPQLEEKLQKKYTEPQKYWEKSNPQIVAKANEILGEKPPETNTQKANQIFQYVVGFLKYDTNRISGNIERFGAVAALNNPQSAICMEFTDLFIALARAAGIPSRELNGYAYTTNNKLRPLALSKEALHSWPEYWDEKRGWVMVDPTWSNTTGGVDYFNKLDLNHIVFAVKGISSETPVPAGSVNFSKGFQDIQVTLSDKDFIGHPQVDVSIKPVSFMFAGFPGKLRVNIVNTGNSFFPSTTLRLISGKLILDTNQNLQTGIIPAFGKAQFDFNVRTDSLFDIYNEEIQVLAGKQQFNNNIQIKPIIFLQKTPVIILGFVIFIMIVIYFTVLGTLIYRRRFLYKKDSKNKP